MKTVKLIGLLGLCAILGGCAMLNARHDMEQSKAAYKACLSEHPGDLAACNSQRAAFEADVAAYETTSKASYLLGGGSIGHSGPSFQRGTNAPAASGVADPNGALIMRCGSRGLAADFATGNCF